MFAVGKRHAGKDIDSGNSVRKLMRVRPKFSALGFAKHFSGFVKPYFAGGGGERIAPYPNSRKKWKTGRIYVSANVIRAKMRKLNAVNGWLCIGFRISTEMMCGGGISTECNDISTNDSVYLPNVYLRNLRISTKCNGLLTE